MVADPHPADMPAGYPRDFERLLRLDDGRQVFIRPITPADRAQLAVAILGADAETLHRRFLGGAPAVTEAVLTHLTTLDYRRRFALIAVDLSTGRGIAIARYEETKTNGTAEVAVVVDPHWRRIGLATALIELLAQAAFERGIREFCATYLAENQPVATLVAHAHGNLTIRQGVAEAAVRLAQTAASENRPAGAESGTPGARRHQRCTAPRVGISGRMTTDRDPFTSVGGDDEHDGKEGTSVPTGLPRPESR